MVLEVIPRIPYSTYFIPKHCIEWCFLLQDLIWDNDSIPVLLLACSCGREKKRRETDRLFVLKSHINISMHTNPSAIILLSTRSNNYTWLGTFSSFYRISRVPSLFLSPFSTKKKNMERMRIVQQAKNTPCYVLIWMKLVDSASDRRWNWESIDFRSQYRGKSASMCAMSYYVPSIYINPFCKYRWIENSKDIGLLFFC